MILGLVIYCASLSALLCLIALMLRPLRQRALVLAALHGVISALCYGYVSFGGLL